MSSICKSASQVVFSRVQLTLHVNRRTPQDASRLVQVLSAWSVETRRAPSRHHREVRVYDHTTKPMHFIEHNLRLSQRELLYHVMFLLMHPRGSYIVPQSLPLDLATPKNKSTH